MSTTKINSDNVDTASIVTLTAPQLLTNKTLQSAYEAVTLTASAPASVTNFDVVSQSIQYYTANATNNFTLNVRGNSGTTLNSLMSVGQTMTVVLFITVGSTGYYPNAFQIDGSAVTPKWLGNLPPNASSTSTVSQYTLTIVKTGSGTFLVLGAANNFF